ncbi:MAG: alpha/beta fold hydrolase [Alphaproteobacteria bacterium]|nr:alpha/beta fold hydrolase [Alphaproteobacteria bacterium]
MPAQTTELRVRDVRIRLHRAGQGPTVLFLHGAGGVPQWLPFFDMLAEHYELLVPEHPGFGGSDDPAWIRSMPDLAMFYLDLIEEAGLDGIHLIGNSLGGWLAAEILIRDRARFRSLVQLAPAGICSKGVPPGDNFIWGPEEALRNLYHDQSFADRILALKPSEEQIDVMLRNRFTVAKFGWQPRWLNPDLEKWLHRIKLPALIVWGDNDKIMPPQYAALWKERLPDARLVRVKDCGHLPHVEHAGPVARHVRQFLEGVAP